MGLLHADARLVDVAGERTLGGPQLAAAVSRFADSLVGLPPGVVFIRTRADLPSVLRYLGAFTAGRSVALLDPALEYEVLADLVARFRPAAVLGVDGASPLDGYYAGGDKGSWLREDPDGVVPHPELAVLLPTSGSTGNPKLVRLSRRAVQHNAEAIAEVLGIDADEVAPTSLPLHYSYGLSVLNSHLVRGATVVIEASGLLARPFWNAVTEYGVTSLAGVPYHYEMLRRLRFDPARCPSLRTLTQAGGKLRDDLVGEFNDTMRGAGGRMFVMYGQTEAAPRMATVPAERLADKLGSAGCALPDGVLSVRRADGKETTQPGIGGEVVYRGPNVMMGYAEREAELAEGDQLGGVLATGDLGYLDRDGYLFITGRLKRIGKVFGNRVSLDDLEHVVRQAELGVDVAAAIAAGDKVVIWLERAPHGACDAAAKALAERLHLHVTGFDVRPIDELPLLANGKVDYQTLEARV
ncbi:MAG: AMP-binding protein [Pseudonocardiaceae bacterium]|nr:AMP-binding protein [Pseudonocardiaceae bacterium]